MFSYLFFGDALIAQTSSCVTKTNNFRGDLINISAKTRTLCITFRSNQLIQHYSAHGGAITNVSFHPSGNFLLSSSLDGTLKIWDLREGQLFYTLHGHEGAVLNCCFSPAGDFFASAGADEQVCYLLGWFISNSPWKSFIFITRNKAVLYILPLLSCRQLLRICWCRRAGVLFVRLVHP